MAYGNVVGYEETGVPGAYRFTDKAGSSWVFSGQAGEDLKAKLDASAGAKTATLDSRQIAAMANRQYAQTPEGQSEAKLMSDIGGAGPPPVASGAAPAAAAPAQGAPAAPGGMRPLGGGLFEGPDGTIYENRPGTRGSKGGLTLTGETRQGVQPEDPEFLAAQEQVQGERTQAMAERQAVEREQQQMEMQHRQEMELAAVNEHIEAQKRDQEINARVMDLESKYDKAEKEVAGSKIDPEGGITFTDSFFLGIGAAAALLNKQPQAIETMVGMLNQKINRNIAAQEHAINVKRETKNDLARMLEVTKGDRNMARAALQAAYTKKAQSAFEARASTTGDRALKAQHREQAAVLADNYLLKRKAWADAARGEVTQAYVNRPAVAGSAGGLAPVRDQLATRGKLLDLKGKEKELAEPPKGAAGDADVAAKEKSVRAGIKAARVALTQLEASSNRAGVVATTGVFGSDESQDLGSRVEALAPVLGKALEENAPNESTMKAIKGALESPDPAKRAAGIRAYKEMLDAKEASYE